MKIKIKIKPNLLHSISNLDGDAFSIIHLFQRDASQILHDPVCTGIFDLLNGMRGIQSHDLEASSFARSNAWRCILHHEDWSGASQSQPITAEQIALRIGLPFLHILGDNQEGWLGELQHLQPARDQPPSSGGDHSPTSSSVLEGLEEWSRTRDLNCAGTKFSGKLTLHLTDV